MQVEARSSAGLGYLKHVPRALRRRRATRVEKNGFRAKYAPQRAFLGTRFARWVVFRGAENLPMDPLIHEIEVFTPLFYSSRDKKNRGILWN